ncbi:MAG: biotin--[acetyl-CoA-carboxylase] ligase, partial [Elusimicrobiota bacterium]
MNKTLPELPFFGSRIEIYRKINSTQARAREIYRESPRISLVASFAQGEGYGRRGSKWVSPPGGLYFSILMKTDCPRAPVPARVALYALKALEKSGRKALWKWPNDIIYKDKKVGGILIESPGKNWIIIGLGLNAFSDINVIPPRLRSRAGLLDLDKKAFLSDFLLNLKKHFPSENLSAGEKEYLNSRLSIKGLYCRVEQKEGIVEGLDKKGALRLQGSEEEYSFFSGSPTLVDRSLFPSRPLVLVDAGNTFTRIGLFKGGVIEKSLNI